MPPWVNQMRKFIVAFVGALAAVLAQGLLDGTARKWVTGIVVFLSAFAVYLVPNEQPTPQPINPASSPPATSP